MLNVKEMIKDNKRVKFTHYQNSEMWYITETGFEFPVSLDDVGTAILLPEDSAMLFMRYINRHIKLIENAKNEQNRI